MLDKTNILTNNFSSDNKIRRYDLCKLMKLHLKINFREKIFTFLLTNRVNWDIFPNDSDDNYIVYYFFDICYIRLTF